MHLDQCTVRRIQVWDRSQSKICPRIKYTALYYSLIKGENMFCSVDSEADNLAAMSQQELLGVAKR